MAVRAFDPQRPPDQELIEDCVHCGFCLPTCPTYVLWGEEMDSPRGRIVLMGVGLDQQEAMSKTMATHFDRCLGCMACVTACPSGVQYDRLIEQTRPQVERNYQRPIGERMYRRLVFGTFPHPGRLRALLPALALAQRTGADRLLAGRPRLGALTRLAPRVKARAAFRRLPAQTRASTPRRGRVGFLQGCIQRVFFGDVNEATVRVLAAEGFDVFAPRLPGCCGALEMHSGEEEAALQRARRMIEAFADCDVVVVNAAGCGSAMKDYRHLLAHDGDWSERAVEFSAKVRDVSEFLAGEEPQAPRGPLSMRVAYHDACHLAHAQGLRVEPRAVLTSIPDLELIEPPDWEVCCGSAGVYNLMQPDAAAALGERKARNLLTTGADAIAAGNPGCTLQISFHLEALGKRLPVYHPMELVDASIRGGRAYGKRRRG
jgi:glycolate oxidase iron-sulfur subunit